jgi:signal transduction protein with GAF and PtsI domain
VGTGQNVLRQKEDISGIVRFISTTERVMEMVLDGVPEDTIAVIDDSGGTLTAPIIEGFKGILCLGGTVRAHLGILAREYGIPCLMDCRIRGLHEGDRVEVEYTAAPPPATQAHVATDEYRAHIWKIDGSA